MLKNLLVAGLAGLTVTACDLPKDPEDTTSEVRGGVLKAGLLRGANTERDQAIVRRLAQQLDAEAEFQTGEAHQLVRAVERGDIHVIGGGLPAATPFKSHLGLSRPAGRLSGSPEGSKRVLAVRAGENGFLVELNRAIAAETAAGGGS